MIKKIILTPLLFLLIFCGTTIAQTDSITNTSEETIIDLKIKPSKTDSTITAVDVAHWVLYNRSMKPGKLFLFLPGTNGIPERGPRKLFETAVEQGYRVINLSYINQPAVAKVCRGENLENDAKCAEKFRTQRIFGTPLTNLIPDEPQDAIIPRLTKLLHYLSEFDKEGNWDTYLEDGIPKWSEISVAGQSQGGGMACFIAKRIRVHQVISFSGGWDNSEKDAIASWYSDESVTPVERWFGTYHVDEPKAKVIDETYEVMAIPREHIYALNETVRTGKKAHGEAIRNSIYKSLWIQIFQYLD